MSYSFHIRAASAALALAAAKAKFDEVVQQQPSHAADRAAAEGAVAAMVGVLPVDDSKDVSVSVSGSVSWTGILDQGHAITGASVSVGAGLLSRPLPASA